MTKLVAQSVINSFFDGKHADPFAVLGMHESAVEYGIVFSN